MFEEFFEDEESPFLTKESFAEAIEKICIDERVNHFQAVIMYCEDVNREFEDVVKLMSKTLLEKVQDGARKMGLMSKEPTIEGL